jgi:hypothetical protein
MPILSIIAPVRAAFFFSLLHPTAAKGILIRALVEGTCSSRPLSGALGSNEVSKLG